MTTDSHIDQLADDAAYWRRRAEAAEAEVARLNHENAALEAEGRTLREAWGAASWYIECLRSYIRKDPVRGMAEAVAGYESARAALAPKEDG